MNSVTADMPFRRGSLGPDEEKKRIAHRMKPIAIVHRREKPPVGGRQGHLLRNG